MCEAPSKGARTGWAGWLDAPSRPASRPNGPWVDLTYSFSRDVPRSALFPPPSLSYFAKMPDKPLNISRLETVVHVGTHVDAPRHFYSDGPGMDNVPLDRMMGEGVVAKITKPPFGAIEARDLEAVDPQIEEGDILALCTGWSKHWGKPDWNRHPHLSMDAAEWCVEKRIKLVAVDTATPDLAYDRRSGDFGFPIHCELLKHGILIAEQLANLESLAGERVEFMFCPIPLADCDGAPARVLARSVA
ncbi:MAG: cyclase family protein [Kiloniellales bacterium]|nr:cyclase family protein [Kiloniellales bacterium]